MSRELQKTANLYLFRIVLSQRDVDEACTQAAADVASNSLFFNGSN